MKIYFLIIFLGLAALSDVSAFDSVLFAEKNTIAADLRTSIEISPDSFDYRVDYVSANISFKTLPYENQKVLLYSTNPESSLTADGASFYWKNPSEKSLTASIHSLVEIQRWQPKIGRKVDFPIRNLNPELLPFTRPSPQIDSDNKEISMLASELADGEDDLYNVVFNIANWTNRNVNYNLSTLDSNVSLPASWVLRNRQGVCGELTDLFIAMVRSLGIPARFVTGIAYTDSPLFPERWGAHGWAEVYFPGYGWVPFDVTYGEFGFIDAAHIKVSDGLSPSDTRIEIISEALGRNFGIRSDELDIDAEIISSDGFFPPDFSMSAIPLKDDVGFGSYNLIELSLINLRDYYISTEITAGNTSGLHVDNPERHILLSPGERRVEYFLVKADEDLDRRYIYTFPLSFYDSSQRQVSTSFSSQFKSPLFERSYFSDFFHSSIKNYFPGLNLSCFPSKGNYYEYERPFVNCSVENTGNTLLSGVYACSDSCIEFELPISQKYYFSFPAASGISSVSVSAAGIVSSSDVDISVSDNPVIVISNVGYPKSVKHGKSFNVSFILEKRSLSSAKNVSVSISNSDLLIERLDFSRELVLGAETDGLAEGPNILDLKMRFEDDNGREYNSQTQVSFVVEKMSLWQRIVFVFRKLIGIFQ